MIPMARDLHPDLCYIYVIYIHIYIINEFLCLLNLVPSRKTGSGRWRTADGTDKSELEHRSFSLFALYNAWEYCVGLLLTDLADCVRTQTSGNPVKSERR